MNTSLSIKEKILSELDIKNLKGVEIGPLANPYVTKNEGDVRYVDRTNTEAIKEWYKDEDIDPDKIVDIDHVWGKETLSQAIGQNEKFDYCIAAHVIEHVPDLIGWLGEISEILSDNGVASFSVPDKRYTFDYLRPETVTADLIEAYLRKLKKPSIRHIFDHYSAFSEIDIVDAWSDSFDGSDLKPKKTPFEVYEICKNAQTNDSYIDSHCWVFTSSSFLTLLDSLNQIGLLDFRIKRFFDVEHFNFEFVVQLEKLPSSLNRDEKRELFLESLEKTRHHILRVEFLSLPAGEAQVYYDSGKGFNELESTTQRFSFTGKRTVLEFNIPPIILRKIRFDPVRSLAIFKIFSIELALFGKINHPIPLETLKPGDFLKIAKYKDKTFWGATSHKVLDPYVIIELPQSIQEES